MAQKQINNEVLCRGFSKVGDMIQTVAETRAVTCKDTASGLAEAGLKRTQPDLSGYGRIFPDLRASELRRSHSTMLRSGNTYIGYQTFLFLPS